MATDVRSPSVPADSDSAAQHGSLWFDDGSIVLGVEDTLFRVHRSILSAHSEVFAGMFQIPQPSGEATIEGCAVVYLPDKAADFVDLLKVLYDPFYFDAILPDDKVERLLVVVSGILRLSIKYSMPPLRQKCIDILGRQIPTSVTALDKIFTTRASGHVHHASELEQVPAAVRIRIVNLARETNVPQFLPFMFYLCARLDSDVIFNGTSTDTLSWEDKTICFLGRDKLLQAQRTFTHSFFVEFTADVR